MAKILIIDDSAMERTVVSGWLSKAGHHVIEATEGESGILLARKHVPDLILMDVIMPGPSGFETTRVIKKDPVLKNIPIVIVSSKDGLADVAWGLRQGAVRYITKPLKQSALLAEISDILPR